jgi:hypothetical protein
MDFSKLTRDASKVHACLQATAKGQLYTSKGCKIYVPVRFADRKLAIIGNDIRVMSIFCIVVEDKYYAVSSALAMMQITPSTTNIIEVNGDEYYEFVFAKGQQITPSLDLLKNDALAYVVYDEVIAKGNIPWYFTYEDLGKIFVTSTEHANITLAANNVPLEMIAAAVARDPSDRRRYYRHRIKTIDEQMKQPPDYVPFRSVIYGATNTTAKLMGSYFDDGLMSALVNPSEKTETVEQLLRR